MTPSKQDLALARDIMDRIERDGAVHLDSLAAVIATHRAVMESKTVTEAGIQEWATWPDARKRLLAYLPLLGRADIYARYTR